MMGKSVKKTASSVYQPEVSPVFWVSCFFISLLIHLGAIGALVFSPFGQPAPARITLPKAIEVDLVGFNPELPAPPAQEDSGDAGDAKARETVPETDTAEKLQKQVPEQQASGRAEKSEARPIPVKTGVKKNLASDYELTEPASQVKTSLKKKTFDAGKVIEGAVKKIAEKSKSRRPQSVENRIAEMQKRVGQMANKGTVSGRVSGSGRSGDRGDYSAMEIYQAEVAVIMKQNWAFSSELAGGGKGLETRVVIKIMPDGSVTDIWFEKRSGNSYLDESAYKTVMKASPLPRLPEGYSHYHLVLGFTPSGLAP
jgi:colicin import membrane protein